jgi:hypothetical protein
MKNLAMLLFILAAAGLTGCAHTYAGLSTLQDTKYPFARQEKIAVTDVQDSATVDLITRLASGTLIEQLRALGCNLAPAADADYQLGFNISDKSVPMTSGVTMPTISNTIGDINGRPINGTTYGEVVVPETQDVNMTQLAVTLQRLHDPKIVVWQGRIEAETADAQQYRAQFFRALLAHLGETVNGDVQLDGDAAPGK